MQARGYATERSSRLSVPAGTRPDGDVQRDLTAPCASRRPPIIPHSSHQKLLAPHPSAIPHSSHQKLLAPHPSAIPHCSRWRLTIPHFYAIPHSLRRNLPHFTSRPLTPRRTCQRRSVLSNIAVLHCEMRRDFWTNRQGSRTLERRQRSCARIFLGKRRITTTRERQDRLAQPD